MKNEYSLDSKICDECIGDSYLKDEINKIGKIAKCKFCGNRNKTITLSHLSDKVETAILMHFDRTATEPDEWEYRLLADKESSYWWDRKGQTICDIMTDEFGIVNEAANFVTKELHERNYDHSAAQIGEETDFDSEAHYELKVISNEHWENEWAEFNQILKSEARYFSPKIIKILRSAFDGIENFRTYSNKSVLTRIGPGEEINTLFRARVFQNRDRLLEALRHPDLLLGTPSTNFATHGRMNAKGISVFYGALNKSTAIAEVRPPVESNVAVAKFNIIRKLQLLDLRELANIRELVSVFDPTYKQRMEKARFLNKLSKKMTSAVMPDDESSDYLPTQVIAEYLSSKEDPIFDGIIFNSVQSKKEGNTNIVLFHKSARVENLEIPPGTLITATDTEFDDLGEYRSYRVKEFVPTRKKKNSDFFNTEIIDNRPASLSVDINEITVNQVNSVVYETEERHVDRTRTKQIKRSTKGKPFLDF